MLSVLIRSFVSVASQTCWTQVSVICTHPLFCFCSKSDMPDTSECYLYSSVLCFCSESDMLDTSKCYLYSSVLCFCSESDMLDTSKCYLYSSVLCFCSESDMLDTSVIRSLFL